jgi:hypothetical protein
LPESTTSVGVAVASSVAATAERSVAVENASIFRPAVQDSTPAPILKPKSADPVMDGGSKVLSIQQLNDVNFALKK